MNGKTYKIHLKSKKQQTRGGQEENIDTTTKITEYYVWYNIFNIINTIKHHELNKINKIDEFDIIYFF